ncbi:hypothetical protein FAVG1_13088 [Fusarium avenaceum]|nr:hypothetical protein FAVG1_13088 [Fusarium avenaceum]
MKVALTNSTADADNDADVTMKETDTEQLTVRPDLGEALDQLLGRQPSDRVVHQHEQDDCQDAVSVAQRDPGIEMDEWREVGTELVNRRFFTESERLIKVAEWAR